MQVLQNVEFVKNSFTCVSHMTCKIRKMFNKLANGQSWFLLHYPHSPRAGWLAATVQVHVTIQPLALHLHVRCQLGGLLTLGQRL